jgi:hypothetical protein
VGMDKLLGFAPDVEPSTPGIFTDCTNIIPYEAGFLGAPTGVAPAGVGVLATGDCRGAGVMQKLDDTRRLIAGTQTKLYELTGTTWTDRSAGAGVYTGSVDSRWSLAQFGDTTLASNLIDAMQSSATGAFAAIAGAPKAQIIVSASNNFVIAFNTNDGTFGVQPDRWWCCAQNDQTSWTPSVATGATTGRIIGLPGKITAALPLGDYVIAYKLRGLWLGSFVGSNNGAWNWTLVPGSGQSGVCGQDAVCDIGGTHFYCGDDDFWLFDGTRPVSIGAEIRNWFKANSSETYRYRTKCTFDRGRNVVWINYPSKTSTGLCDSTLVWHTGTKRWGRADVVVEAALNYISPGVTMNGLDAYGSSMNAIPQVPFDSAFWQGGGRVYAYFDGTHQLVVNNGVCGSSGYTTGDYGSDEGVLDLDHFVIRFILSPTTSQAQGAYRDDPGGALNAGPIEQRYNQRYDVRQAGKWHRLLASMTGDHKESAHSVVFNQEGGGER